jgi:hypothetical protein
MNVHRGRRTTTSITLEDGTIWNGIVSSENLDTLFLIDSVNPEVAYICEAPIGSLTSAPVWQISRMTKNNGSIVIGSAGGGAFNQIADNRESLTYSQ